MIAYNIMRGNPATLVKAVKPKGSQTVKAMGENLVNMAFTLPVYVDFKLNDFIVLDGEKYIINEDVQWEKSGNRKYSYSVQFQHEFYDLAKVQLKFLDPSNGYRQTKFDIMGNASTIVGLVVESINQNYSGWSVGVVDDTDYKLFSFDATNCLKALYQLVDEFKTEVWFDNKTIHLQKRVQSSGLSLAYGKGNGLLNISRQNKTDANIITHLLVSGSSTNLPSGYRDNVGNLILPGGLNYYQDNAKVALYGHIEDSITFDIKPEREGSVTAVVAGDGNWKYFTDNTLDFDINAQRAAGLEAKVSFLTGQLAGYNYTIDNYNHATKTFTINKNEDEKALDLPNNLFRPAVGDKYSLIDIVMPQSYVNDAEARLLAATLEYYNANSEPKFLVAYSASVDKLFVKQNNVNLQLGNTIVFPDAELGLNVELRIAGYTRDLENRDFYEEIEWADNLTVNEVARQSQQQQRTLRAIESSGLLNPDAIRKNIFLNRLSELNGYLMLSGQKVKAGLADFATDAAHAAIADYAWDADKWDGRQFADYLNQPVRQTDAVKFASVVADAVNSTVYVSGFTGSGYRINPDGSAEFDSLTVRKELNINVLNVREITGSGGSVAITNVAKIKNVRDEVGYYGCDIDTDGNTIAVQLRVNDLVRCQIWDGKRLKYYTAKVLGVSAGTFDLDKSSFVGGGIPQAGDTVFQFGNTSDVSRQGLIYLTNSDTGAPYLDVLDGITSDNLTGKTKVRLGKLNGINDADLGQLDGYGIYAERAFIKGKIVVTGGNAETVTGSQTKADAAQANAINTASGDASAKANNAIAVASSDAQNKANAAQTAAAGYTDSKALATISAAQTYADNSATSKANAAQANAISQASTDAQNKANAAQANAALLSQQLVDGIKVGSRNLILNSNIPVENNAYSLNVYSLAMSAVVGETYTFSAKVNLSAGQTGIYLNVIDYVNYPSIAELVYPDADGIFRKTFVMPNGATSYNYIGLYTTPLGNYQIAKAFWVKLEKGNKATDWTPAPEDVQNAIDNAKALANAANASYASLTANLKSLAYADVVELAKLGTTIIEGGKIKTTLLDADYIRANIVNAGYINTLELDATAIKSGTIDSARINASQIISNGGGATTTQLNQAKQDAENAAKAYADAQDNLKKIEANAYADGKVSAEEQRAINDAIAKLNEAKADATAKDNAVKAYADNAKLEAITTATTQSAADATVKASQAQVTAIQTAAADATQKANNALIAASNDATYKAEEAKRYAEAKSYMAGKMLNRDADFRDGLNGINVYNNEGNGNVQIDRLGRSDWGNGQSALPTTSPYGVRIKNIGSSQPGLGGFYFGTQTRPNAKFVTRIIAYIPVGLTIHFHSNATGDNGYGYWATPVVGTGTWQEYIYVLQCGNSGTFSSTNFFALDGNNYGMEWYLAYATVFDVTDSEVNYLKDAQAKADAAQLAATNLAYAQAAYEREVAKAYADGIVTAEEQARIAQAAANLQNAKDDAQNKVNIALGSANGYTDTKSQQTLVAAQTYADNSAQNKANAAQANAISQASTDAQNKANAAQANAALLSQQLVDGIKVGGRNLIIGSNTIIENSNYSLNVYSLANSAVVGETYTFSAKVNLSAGQTGIYLNVIDGANYPSIAENVYPDADGIFRKTFVMPNGAVSYGSIGLYTTPLGNYQTGKVFWVKLEKGNKATDWTPAPEDVQYAIDNAKALANAANASYASLTANLKSLAYADVVELAKLGTTIIEGGKIKTTLLDADYIRANIVNAAYINTLEIVTKNLKTSATGKRVEIDSANNNIRILNDQSAVLIELDDDSAYEYTRLYFNGPPIGNTYTKFYGPGIRVGNETAARTTMGRYGFTVFDENNAIKHKIGTYSQSNVFLDREDVIFDIQNGFILKNVTASWDANNQYGTKQTAIRVFAETISWDNGSANVLTWIPA